MNTIYLLIGSYYCEGATVIGAFASRQAAIASFATKLHDSYDTVELQTWNLGDTEETRTAASDKTLFDRESGRPRATWATIKLPKGSKANVCQFDVQILKQ